MSVGYPGSHRAAVDQHRNGDADHWAACSTCSAADGEPCRSRAQRRELPGRGREPQRAKLNPCTGRGYRVKP